MRSMFLLAFVLALAACSGGGGSTTSLPVPAPAQPQMFANAPVAAAGHKTYTVPAGACHITYCSGAPLLYNGHQVNTVGYTDGVTYFTNTPFIGSFSFGTRLFTDFNGTFTDVGTVTIGGLTYSVWNLAGKFSNGKDTALETFDVRGHSGRGGGTTIINAGGTVVTPLVTPAPTPPPPSPTPVPSPTDDQASRS